MAMARRCVSTLVAAVLASSCEVPPTQIILRVESDIAPARVGGVLRAVDVRVGYGPGAWETSRAVRLDVAGEAFPGEFAVTAADPNDQRPIRFTVVGALSDGTSLRREFVVRFSPRRTTVLEAFLADRCRGVTCPSDRTCGRDAVCEPILRDELPLYAPLRDATVAARDDIAPSTDDSSVTEVTTGAGDAIGGEVVDVPTDDTDGSEDAVTADTRAAPNDVLDASMSGDAAEMPDTFIRDDIIDAPSDIVQRCGDVGERHVCGGACVDLQNDRTHCGACGVACATGRVCSLGRCEIPPPNDRCADAQVLSMVGTSTQASANTAGATHDLQAPCAPSLAGPDVFYRFTIAGPASEIISADTFGTSSDTVVFFASSCTSALPTAGAPGVVACNDDAITLGCGVSSGRASQAVAILPPGTHFLVLTGSAAVSAVIHIQHLPIGNGGATLLGSETTVSGRTSRMGVIGNIGSGHMGPENTYWWRTCQEAPAMTVTATSCGTSWPSTLYVSSGVGAPFNVGISCGAGMILTASDPAGAGIHTLNVDGVAAGNSGDYVVQVSRR